RILGRGASGRPTRVVPFQREAEPMKRLVLFFNDFWDLDPTQNLPAGIPSDLELTSDIRRFSQSDAVVFHLPSMYRWDGITKLRGQKWVAVSWESEVCYPFLSDPAFTARFDVTATYQLNSDVPVLYLRPETAKDLRQPVQEKTADAPAVLFISNASPRSGRTEYLTELMQYMPIHSCGRWCPNRALPEDRGRDSKRETIARYKFTLAFENSLARDYVTEKLYDPLIAGSVPVYQGAPNADEFAPGELCFVNADDFGGPRD